MLERKEQIEGEDHQIMNQEVEDETDVGKGKERGIHIQKVKDLMLRKKREERLYLL